jgi:hypothetical protein
MDDKAGKEHFYFYVVVVFGLGPAEQTLGRVMRPVLKFLTDAGIRNLMYVDDGWIVAALKEKADRDYETTILTFEKAGFVISREKSDSLGSSSQRKEYLGFIINTATLTVEVPKPKLDRIGKLLKAFLLSPRHKVMEVASIVGKLISLEPALGRSIMVCTRLATIEVVAATEVSEIAKRRRNPWESTVTLRQETMELLGNILNRLEEWNGFPMRAWHTGITLSSILPLEARASLDRKIPACKVHDRRAVMARDASNFAVVSYSVEGIPEFSFSDELSWEERGESSSYRELMVIDRKLVHMALLENFLMPAAWTTLWWLTDNQNVEKMLSKGSGKLSQCPLLNPTLHTCFLLAHATPIQTVVLLSYCFLYQEKRKDTE